MKKNKGFTLAEMLIVVAIIGILIAILIPTFTAQLDKARAATDKANIRSIIAECTANYLSSEGKTSDTYTLTSSSVAGEKIGGATVPSGKKAGDVVNISCSTGVPSIS